MPAERVRLEVAVEAGSKRCFASAVDWPGWTRAGRDEPGAMAALVAYGPRYQRAIALATDRALPGEPADMVVVEQLPGNATTDFGAPAALFAIDRAPLTDDDGARLKAIIDGCWSAIDRAAGAAAGIELRKGPRGGGRSVHAIEGHVNASAVSYLRAVGGSAADGWSAAELRAAIGDWLAAAARGELAEQGRRGGKRWPPRTFARRLGWHILDHCWEIEDRAGLPESGG